MTDLPHSSAGAGLEKFLSGIFAAIYIWPELLKTSSSICNSLLNYSNGYLER